MFTWRLTYLKIPTYMAVLWPVYPASYFGHIGLTWAVFKNGIYRCNFTSKVIMRATRKRTQLVCESIWQSIRSFPNISLVIYGVKSIWCLISIFSGRKPGEGPPGSDGNWPGNGEGPGSGEGSGEGEGEGQGPGVGVGPDGPNGPQLPLGPGRFPITYPLPNPTILKLIKLLPFCDQHMEYTCHVCFDINKYVRYGNIFKWISNFKTKCIETFFLKQQKLIL